MIDIPAIFRHKKPEPKKLLEYGFSVSEGFYTTDIPIMEGQYFARIRISEEGSVDLQVFETENGEEYMPAHVYTAAGAFVGEIHEACEKVLTDISEKCCHTERLKEEQSKRILAFIRDRYGAEPEFLWDRFPETAAIRIPGKKSWFALIGRVPKAKFGLDEAGSVEILNLKDEPKLVTARVDKEKVFPAYHMNKSHWYTIFLDGRLSDEEIQAFIEKSYKVVDS